MGKGSEAVELPKPPRFPWEELDPCTGNVRNAIKELENGNLPTGTLDMSCKRYSDVMHISEWTKTCLDALEMECDEQLEDGWGDDNEDLYCEYITEVIAHFNKYGNCY